MTRREFLSYSAMAGVVGAIGVSPILSACAGGKKKNAYEPLRAEGEYYVPDLPDKAVAGRELKAGVIGCGGRGSGAAENFLAAADGVTITAIGDVFPDRVQSLKQMLHDKYQVDLADENCFTGFDAYKNVIDSGVDVVIIATPRFFRPEHFKYATEKGVHSFLEKPICVDAEGYRTVMAAAKQAKAKGLCVLTGTQRHHQRAYVESFKRIQQGMIGEITGGNVYWNQPMLWYRSREKGWSDMEWMLRDWVNWKWLSGDHIVEQHVHNIDVFNWFFGYKQPISATAFGSRQRRVTGDQYDNFSVDFEYENGVHVHSMSRQIDGCDTNISEFIHGTKGTWESGPMVSGACVIKDLDGNVLWSYDLEAEKTEHQQNDPYTLEHVNWISSIRNNTPFVQAEETALSNMCGIMGRESAYTGKTITWEQMTASPLSYAPAKLELGPMDMSAYTVPVPGTGK